MTEYIDRLEQLGEENARLQTDLDLLTQMREALEAIQRLAASRDHGAALDEIERLATNALRHVEGRKP